MSFWRGRRVLVTGHTGFKGGWLSLWLQQLGADVCGVALPPPGDPSIFTEARVALAMRSDMADIRDFERVAAILREHRPEVVFHMAAQPLVRRSYEDPVATYATNVMGTVNVLESVRRCESVRAVVVITTDKCYENKEWVWPYRETDRLGGYDPYSNSKACAELVVSAYRSSFFSPAEYSRHGVAIASARAGNVIGGGDWSEGRLVPDIMRAFAANQVLRIRNPHAVRPWQHVLEPLSGYLTLAEKLFQEGVQYDDAWNFGPEHSDAKPVEWIVRELADIWSGDVRWELDKTAQPHEAATLKLDWSKAATYLGWRPKLGLKEALRITAEWYTERLKRHDMRAYTIAQIEEYEMHQPADAIAEGEWREASA
jgi:CDP-glucose 4,6-dehydratase